MSDKNSNTCERSKLTNVQLTGESMSDQMRLTNARLFSRGDAGRSAVDDLRSSFRGATPAGRCRLSSAFSPRGDAGRSTVDGLLSPLLGRLDCSFFFLFFLYRSCPLYIPPEECPSSKISPAVKICLKMPCT